MDKKITTREKINIIKNNKILLGYIFKFAPEMFLWKMFGVIMILASDISFNILFIYFWKTPNFIYYIYCISTFFFQSVLFYFFPEFFRKVFVHFIFTEKIDIHEFIKGFIHPPGYP